MKDPWNPTDEELRVWAFDAEAYPEQDWDLAIADIRYSQLILSLASDASCPNRDFFLHCLYLIVGDAVRSHWQTSQKSQIDSLLFEAAESTDAKILKWIDRSTHLISNPSEFDYGLWCDGGYVNQDVAPHAKHG